MAFSRRKSFRKKTIPKRRPKKGVKKVSIKKMIKKEIARTVENKTLQAYNIGQSIRSVIHANFPQQIIQVSPGAALLPISQGVGQGNRVGNVINLKKLRIKGTIVPQAYSAGVLPVPTPSQIAIYVFADKLSEPNAILSTPTDFFQAGNSTRGFANDLVDQWSQVNTDRYQVFYKKSFKVGFANYNGTGAFPDAQFYSNNDFKLNQNFSIDLMPGAIKRVKYNDASTDPICRSLYLMFVPSRADGGAYSSSETAAGVQWTLDMVYEDA